MNLEELFPPGGLSTRKKTQHKRRRQGGEKGASHIRKYLLLWYKMTDL